MVKDAHVLIFGLMKPRYRSLAVAQQTALRFHIPGKSAPSVVALYYSPFYFILGKPPRRFRLCRFHRVLRIVHIKNEVTYFRFYVDDATKVVRARVRRIYIGFNRMLPGYGYRFVGLKTAFVHQARKRLRVLHVLRFKYPRIFFFKVVQFL